MYTIGYDIGSSSIKGVIFDAEAGKVLASAFAPHQEMPIYASQPGWAEQDPLMWWEHVRSVTREMIQGSRIDRSRIGAIGIAYQMHGLVLIDRARGVLRPAIIWCDSRATGIGRRAFDTIGHERCIERLLNSPGNFTASKLRWVIENEPEIFRRAGWFMLPGDYVALRLTDAVSTTVPGLSEGMLWDFVSKAPAEFLLSEYGIPPTLIPEIVPTFGVQGVLSRSAADDLGLHAGIPITYRAGDQPNNALSLNVLQPGEVASTAGTSGVVYAVSGTLEADSTSRVNAFAHVNHSAADPRIGILLCINGCGIANSWTRRILSSGGMSYDEMNARASEVPAGSLGVLVLPFGNGAERMLSDVDTRAQIRGLNFNTHSDAHLYRAVQEGVAFSFQYGLDLLATLGIRPTILRAGDANLFRSPIFCQTLANCTGVAIELYDTDGAQGAARGAAMGAGFFKSAAEIARGLSRKKVIEPEKALQNQFRGLYANWKAALDHTLAERS